MTEQEVREKSIANRKIMRWGDEDFDSDQDRKLPQPPLVKEADPENDIIPLPRNFKDISLENDLVKTIYNRRSNRVFTEEKMSLLQFSFLCFAQQGIKSIRGKKYAALRTVPSGGARHAFELYALVLNVEGLETGLYHYLAMTHELELLQLIDTKDEAFMQKASESLCEQEWGLKGNVVFYYSCMYYRGEWRYGFDAHRVMLIDAGHAMQNLYISCTASGFGTCAIAALEDRVCNELFGLDGVEESIFYAAPVGTVNAKNEEDEQAFYAFLNEE